MRTATTELETVRATVLRRLREADPIAIRASLRALIADTILEELEVDKVEPSHVLMLDVLTEALSSRRCSSCAGNLVGLEVGFGTCGHCGGRSIHPTTREELS